MKQRIDDALAQLQAVSQQAIRDAGPRYTPGLDPAAPNIEIGYLVDAFDALSLVDGWRSRIRGLTERVKEESEHRAYLLDRLFRRCRATPARMVEQVQALREVREPIALRRDTLQLRRNSEQVVRRLQRETDALWEQLRELPDEPSNRERRDRLQSNVRAIGGVMAVVEELVAYLDGPSGRFLRGANGLLLLGSWGTGKTHLLCDIVQQRLHAGAPALLVMASSLPRSASLLDGIATTTGLANSGAELLGELNRLGAATNVRALLMIDAINEGSQEIWRNQLQSLASAIRQWPNVGLVVSCRRPFDEAIVTEQAARRLVVLEHFGFQDQEFDAQLEYFSFYDLPAPSVPLITPEFTRPLFLKILCEGLKNLGRRSQQRKLREIASGQKGMTYVLEYYTKNVGRGIEVDLGLDHGSCWLALKGDKTDAGLAGRMAAQGSDWLSTEDAIASLEASLALAKQQAEDVLRRFIHEGLLATVVRRPDSRVVAGVQFSYQRFGDHLIARHLLDAHLETATEQSLRRCFYRNRPLGRPFRLNQWGHQFEDPGIAAALMLEFPERMKRSLLSHELLNHLPKATRRVSPVKEVFLDGLYWRSADAFTDDTDRLVSFFLTQVDDWTRDETFEVLVGLATRPTHPYSATRLSDYLSQQTMPLRDQAWSEFLRRSDEQSNVQRILAWVERSAERDESAVRNEVRLLSLFLTTTNRSLRDRATRGLVVRGSERPDILFDEVLQSLGFNDPYVPERMLAAAYGVAMRLWADPNGESLRAAIVPFARSLVRQMFVANAPHPTKHVLQRGYALGVIALARKINPRAIASRRIALLSPPFSQIPSPFVDPAEINEMEVKDSRGAMHMDFENYTIGRLIPDRGNYQEGHPGYQEVRRQIARRMSDLGYSSAFSELDRSIAQTQSLSRESDGAKTDRYGKKYSWIAFFEMYGVRSDLDLLGERRSRERSSDCDVDPSFPPPPEEWVPPLPDLFTRAPTDYGGWLAAGPVPDYRHLLVLPRIDGAVDGPWVLLNGFIQQSGSSDRETFTFLRGLLMRKRDIGQVKEAMSTLDYLGNSRVPEPGDDYYTYAGEIPWSPFYAGDFHLRNGRARRHVSPMLERFSAGRWIASGRVEVPVHRWAWESYHSALNEVSGIEFLAPALCEKLGLVNHNGTFDLWDEDGHRASVYREFDVADRFGNSSLLYLRQDLLERYLSLTEQVLVWIPWGERTLNSKLFSGGRLEEPAAVAALQNNRNNFGELIEYATFTRDATGHSGGTAIAASDP
jgi:hypothetical protein